MTGGDKHALDNLRNTLDYVASGLQPSRSWQSDSLAAGSGIGSFGHQSLERPPGRVEPFLKLKRG
jgi:hypothetical protein